MYTCYWDSTVKPHYLIVIHVLPPAGPDDYTGLNRVPITFTPGATSRSVLLRTVEDNDVEDTETLTATLTVDNDIYPGVSLSPDSAIINIIDDDCMYHSRLRFHKQTFLPATFIVTHT